LDTGPVDPFLTRVFFAVALALLARAAGFFVLLPALALGVAFAAALEVFAVFLEEDFVAADFAWAFLDFGALLEPASRVAFFAATGAFAT
jgi:hypothetical protein